MFLWHNNYFKIIIFKLFLNSYFKKLIDSRNVITLWAKIVIININTNTYLIEVF